MTVTVEAKQAITGLALDENLPEGWKITLIDNAGAVFNAQETQWLWLEVSAGETKVIRYQVEIPGDASLEALYEITGVIRGASPSLVLEGRGGRSTGREATRREARGCGDSQPGARRAYRDLPCTRRARPARRNDQGTDLRPGGAASLRERRGRNEP